MKFAALLPIFFALAAALAATPEECEIILTRARNAVYRLTEKALREHQISVEDVELMLAGPRLGNPMRSKAGTPENSAMKEAYDRALLALGDVKPDTLRPRLKEITNGALKDAQTAATARSATQPIFNPYLKSRTHEVFGGFSRRFRWYSEQGEDWLVSYDPGSSALTAYKNGAADPAFNRNLFDRPGRDYRGICETSEIFISKKNHPFVVATTMEPERGILAVHDVARDKTFKLDIPRIPLGSQLLEGPNGEIFAVAITSRTIEVYKVGDELTLVRKIKISGDAEMPRMVRGQNGRYLVSIVVDKKNLQIFEPFQSEQPVGDFKFKAEISDVGMTITPDHRYLLALSVGAKTLFHAQAGFLAEGDRDLTPAKLDGTLQLGEWFETADGRTLFAIGANRKKGTNTLAVFEPLAKSVASAKKPLWPGAAKLLPVVEMELKGRTRLAPKWYKTVDGRLLLFDVVDAPSPLVQVFEPLVGKSPVQSFDPQAPHISEFHLMEFPQSGQLIFYTTRYGEYELVVSDVFSGTVIYQSPPNTALDLSAPFHLSNGDFVLASQGTIRPMKVSIFSFLGETQ